VIRHPQPSEHEVRDVSDDGILVDLNGEPVSDEPVPPHVARFTEAFLRDIRQQWDRAQADEGPET
jgi:hypothetical protein